MNAPAIERLDFSQRNPLIPNCRFYSLDLCAWRLSSLFFETDHEPTILFRLSSWFLLLFFFLFPSVRLEDHYSKAMHTSGLSFPATESWKEKLKQYKPLIYLGGLTLGYIVFHLNSWSPEAILPLCFFIS
jgi:hypothetical protein